MKIERSSVEHPLWRKKVDASILEGVTPIPKWVCKMWNIPELFQTCVSQSDPNAEVKVSFQDREYIGTVTVVKRNSPLFRLFLDEALAQELKQTFLMSYMRAVEAKLRSEQKSDIEEEIPFWEFLDIEFDSTKKSFLFIAYYTQQPLFPTVFKRLVSERLI